jgi:hypothetical protein
MNLKTTMLITAAMFLLPATAAAERSPEQRPCAEMIESWYGVDPTPLDHLLHPNFIKQGVFVDPKTGETRTPTMDKAAFSAAVGADREPLPKDQWDISVETVEWSGPIATVRVTSAHLIDVCQLGLVDGDWKVINVIWTLREG